MKPDKAGFKTILVKYDSKCSGIDQIFYKQHKIREESTDRPSDVTLFVCNVPPYYNDECLKRIFRSFGPVKIVFFASPDDPTTIVPQQSNSKSSIQREEINGYKVAYVVFYSAADMQKALDWKCEEPVILVSDEFELLTGLEKYIEEYNNSFPDTPAMEKEIKEFMSKYDKELQKTEKLMKESEEPNDDGWVTVTKRGKNPGFARKKSVKDNILKTMRRKKQRKTLMNFYTFQIRESKMNHLEKLRVKFEEDKKKLEHMKNQRKFKPF